MRSAILTAANSAGTINTASLMHDETDENEIIQLRIGEYKYTFNNEGKLQSSTEVVSCYNNSFCKGTCAEIQQTISCTPIEGNEE